MLWGIGLCYGCLSLVSVVCFCQVDVSVTGRSLVQRSPTECDIWVWSRNLNLGPLRLSTHAIRKESADCVNGNDGIMQKATNSLPTAFPEGGGCYLPRSFLFSCTVKQNTYCQAYSYGHAFIHSVFCLTTGPKPPPKRFLHIVRSRASSFKWEYALLSVRSSSTCT